MKKLLLILSLISFPAQALEPDKKKHLWVGVMAGAFGSAAKDRPTGIILGCGLGFAKEVYDVKHGTPEVLDFAATCLGAVVASQGVHMFRVYANKVEWRMEW